MRNGNSGETLAELLIAVLVITLGLTMFASALLTSGRIMKRSENYFLNYYAEKNEQNRESDGESDWLVLEEAGHRKNLGASAPDRPAGSYPIWVFGNDHYRRAE